MKTITIKNTFEEKSKKINIPYFLWEKKIDLLEIKEVTLDKNNLLEGFPLDEADIKLEILVILLASCK